MNKVIRRIMTCICIFTLCMGSIENIEANSKVLSITYPDRYSTGRMIYASGSGIVCEDEKDHRLFKLGEEERFLGVFKLGNEVVYCVEPFVETKSGYTYTSTSFKNANLNKDVIEKLELASYFGYGYNKDYSMLTRIATQHAIWELQGVKVSDISAALREKINEIKAKVETFVNMKKPSFDGKTYTFTGVGKEHKLTINDKNKVLSSYFDATVSSGLQYEKEGNTIYVWVEEPFSGEKSITYNLLDEKANKSGGSSILYINKENAQKLAVFQNPTQKSAQISFTMAMGDFEIVKMKSDSLDEKGTLSFEKNARFVVMKEEDISYYGDFDTAYKNRKSLKDINYDVIETNEQGIAISKKLLYGRYLIKQIAADVDTQLCKDTFLFEVKEANQKRQTFTIINPTYGAYVKVIKKDEAGNSVFSNPMKFRILDSNYQPIMIDGQEIWETKENGEVILPSKLKAGIYYVEEIEAPHGFVLSKEKIKFEITNTRSPSYKEGEEDVFEVIVVNKKPEVSIRIHKQFEGEAKREGEVSFELFAYEDIYDASSHALLYRQGESLGIYTCDETNCITIEHLPLGLGKVTYALQEKTTYPSYQLDDTMHLFTFEENTRDAYYHMEKTILNKKIKLQTIAMDHVDKDKIVISNGNERIEDHVYYEGLNIGETYTLKGYMVDKKTGEVLTNDKGSAITSSITFQSKTKNGNIVLSYLMDCVYECEKEVVLCAFLYDEKGNLLIAHEDLNDENQTIYVKVREKLSVPTKDNSNIRQYYVILLGSCLYLCKKFMKK